MSRRKTVKLNLSTIGPLIKEKCRSYTVFCEKMERANNWATDWLRKDKDGNPTPKNLPSPEEAARMCAILQVRPEDILTEQADIELVRGLIDSQKEKPAHDVDELSPAKQKLIATIDELSDEQCEKLFGIIEEAKKLL